MITHPSHLMPFSISFPIFPSMSNCETAEPPNCLTDLRSLHV